MSSESLKARLVLHAFDAVAGKLLSIKGLARLFCKVWSLSISSCGGEVGKGGGGKRREFKLAEMGVSLLRGGGGGGGGEGKFVYVLWVHIQLC